MLEFKKITKVVGVKQSLKSINNENCIYVFVARDAEKRVVQQLIDKALELSIEVKYVDTMIDLGKICDIDVGAAAALFLEEN